MSKQIHIFTKEGCPYCKNAINFFDKMRLSYKEIKLSPSSSNYNRDKLKLFNHFNHHSFPIIIIGNTMLGGYSDLIDAYNSGKLQHLFSINGIK